MCVIAIAAKKRHMKRAEVLEAIRRNSAGFFGFTVHDGRRRTIRTLDDKQFMEFFDSVDDDDVWAMHARIPSRGEKSLDNVHGWEEDGILFAHNMTLSVLDDMMKRVNWTNTDSEFFFRKVFIPYFRGLGEDAYKDGKLHPDLDNLVRHFCGSYNKLLFIMPDNRMLRYGEWIEERDRKEGDEVAFYASNASYKVYEPKWPARKTVTGFGARSMYDDDDVDGWGEYYGGYGWHGGESWTAKGTGKDDGGSDAGKGVDSDKAAVDLVWRELGPSRLCQLALLDLVGNGAVSYRALRGDWAPDGENDEVDEVLHDLLPDIFDEDTYTTAVGGLQTLARVPHVVGETGDVLERYGPEDFAKEYAAAVAGGIVRTGYAAHNRTKIPAVVPTFPEAEYAAAAVERFERQWRIFCRVAGVAVDFAGAKGPASFACVADSPVRADGKWKTAKVRADDIVVDEDMFPDEAFKAIAVVLEYIQSSCAKEKEAVA